MAKEKISGIYCIENKVNGKKYIGLSKNIYSRWDSHISVLRSGLHYNEYLQNSWNKYGESNFKFYILEQCESCKLPDNEIYYIQKYNTIDKKYGYNLHANKAKGLAFHESTLLKMREVNKNKAVPIVQISVFGDVVYWEYGARQASKNTNIDQALIWRCINGECATAGNYVWLKKEEYDEYNFNIFDHIRNSQRLKPIVQLSLDGDVVGKYENPTVANEKTGIDLNSISKCIRGKNKVASGYYWLYLEKYMSGNYSLGKPNKTRIIQYDLEGNFIKIWDSIASASKFYNLHESTIRKCCKKERDDYGGFSWKYYNHPKLSRGNHL